MNSTASRVSAVEYSRDVLRNILQTRTIPQPVVHHCCRMMSSAPIQRANWTRLAGVFRTSREASSSGMTWRIAGAGCN